MVVDGAYAKAPFLSPAMALGFTVVSRLRKDAALWTVPGPRQPGRRGRPRIYGEQRIDLAKRAGQRRGWSTDIFHLYGEATEKRYKTFLATWRPAGGVIRVVLVDEPTGWVAFFCTDPNVTVAEILGAVADRFSLEIAFRDCKEIVGAGQQQVRHVWANVGSFLICLWTFTMTEVWAWSRATRIWWTVRPRRGTSRHGGQVTQTSATHCAASFSARNYAKFYSPDSQKQKSKRLQNGCSWSRRWPGTARPGGDA